MKIDAQNRELHDEGQLRAYLDGELSVIKMAEVAGHIENCEECRAMLMGLRKGAVEVGAALALPVHTPDAQAALRGLRSMVASPIVSLPERTSTWQGSTSWMPPAGKAAKHVVASRPRLRTRAAMSTLGLGLAAVLVLGLAVVWGRMSNLAGGGILQVPTTVTTPSSSLAALPINTLPGISEFVPAGMVRHLVYSDTTISRSSPQDFHQLGSRSLEAWFGNGSSHLLMYVHPSSAGQDSKSNEPSTWVEDNAIYNYQPSQDNTVFKYAYNSRYVSMLGPDAGAIDAKLKSLPNARIAGQATVMGRPAVEIESITNRPTPTPASTTKDAPPVYSYSPSTTETYLWLDKDTGQLLKRQYVAHYTEGSLAGQVTTNTVVLEKNDLFDASYLPEDFFKFKLPPGAKLVENEKDPLTVEAPEFHSDWYEFQADKGNFAVLMPRTPDASDTNNSLFTFGAKRDSVTYGVKYRDYTGDLTASENAAATDSIYSIGTPAGQVLSQRPISLGKYHGKEFRVLDTNNNYRIWRIYVTNHRIYTVFTIAPDDKTATGDIQKFFDSFRLLQP